MAFSQLAAAQLGQSKPNPLSLLLLPVEILDQIFLYSLIPDQIWINVISNKLNGPTGSDLELTAPFARLTYFVTEAGSQFCLQQFSLNQLMISRSLHAQLMALLCRRTVFRLAEVPDAYLFLNRTSKYRLLKGITHISIPLKDAGLGGLSSISYENNIVPVRQCRWLRSLEVRVDIESFAPLRSTNEKLRSKGLDTIGLLESYLLAFTMTPDSDVVSFFPQLKLRHTISPAEVRIPCFERDRGRQKLLAGKLLNNFCKVDWVRTRHDRYGGPAGYIRLQQTPGKPRICCELLLLTLIVLASDADGKFSLKLHAEF